MNPALIIFIKNPELGKVKTRLAMEIGELQALKVYQLLLGITQKATDKVLCSKYVFYSDYIENDDNWENGNYIKRIQCRGSLGDRMLNAFKEITGMGHSPVVIIGSDCPEIEVEQIELAFESLQLQDVVIGPASDGGYYLIGMNRLYPQLFWDKSWSSPYLLNETLENLRNDKIRFKQIKELSDLDNVNDLYRYTLDYKI